MGELFVLCDEGTKRFELNPEEEKKKSEKSENKKRK